MFQMTIYISTKTQWVTTVDIQLAVQHNYVPNLKAVNVLNSMEVSISFILITMMLSLTAAVQAESVRTKFDLFIHIT